jgi:hypothetical protein
MRLENLYPNFATLTFDDQVAFVASYRARRAEDFLIILKKKGSKKSEGSKPVLTEEEKILCKVLGMTQKNLLALKAMREVEPVEEEGAEELFKDDTYDLEGEEE